jgi:hypothetical protein
MPPFIAETLEARQLFSIAMPAADLLVDSNRDGVLTGADDSNEDKWTSGKSGRGAVILPNFDRDNTLPFGAPDNWTGGNWNGRPVAANNIIDNAADLADIGKLRLRKLNVDDAYNYRVTIQVLRPATDPAWFQSTAAANRVRLFFPTQARANGDVVCQPGDAAVIGPGVGDTVRFVRNPTAANEYSVMDLGGAGWMEFGLEGITAGAQVRFRVTVEYDPLIIFSMPAGGGVEEPTNPPPVSDTVAVRVAPFTLADNRQRVTKVFVENMNRYPGFDNAEARNTLKNVFGSKFAESRTGDLWQQDGYEVGYVKSPYGQRPVVLELPRANSYFFDTAASMRTYIRGTLLGAGVGVSLEVATLPDDSGSAYGGDIESISRGAGKPGWLLASGMPTKMRSYFEAQAVNPLLDLKLDDWMSVAHVDEVVQMNSTGNKAIVADAEMAWALLLWAQKLKGDVRAFANMNGVEQLPGTTAEGIRISQILGNATLRFQNLNYASAANRLGAVHAAIRKAMNLTDEVTMPVADAANTGTARLVRGGAFAALLGKTKRSFEVKFIDGDRYRLRYRDGSGAWSGWAEGRRSNDEVFPAARAYLLKSQWTGGAKAGDRFTFSTNPNATLIKMPVLFNGPFTLFESNSPAATSVIGDGKLRLIPFSSNHVNSLVDGATVVSGRAHGPRVHWNGSGSSDILESYATAAFKQVGYTRVVYTDTRLYHNASGDLHCGTNAIREIPSLKWWEA